MRIKNFFVFGCIFLLVACSENKQEVVVDVQDIVTINKDQTLKQSTSEENKYYFGFDLRSSPQEDAKQYLPFLNYLKDATGYTFELKFTAKDNEITGDLANGLIDFAAIGAGSYISASTHHNLNSLVRGKNNKGKAEYRSFIVVAKDSKIKNLDDLKGKTFAFGGKSSTQGHIIPRIILSKAGITLDDFKNFTYTGSHQKCANAVIAKKADACGMQDTMASTMAQQGLIKILFKSEYYPSSGIVASQQVPVDVRNKVTQALLNFEPEGKHQALLYNWHKTEMPKGFVASSDKDYKDLRDWANKLGLLEE